MQYERTVGHSEVSFIVTDTVRAPLDTVWLTLGDFGNEHRWTRILAHCERDTPEVSVGTARTCTLPKPLMGRSVAHETLTEYEWGSALAYTLEGSAGPFLTARSRWTTRPGQGQTTLVAVEGRFIPRNRLVRLLVWPVARIMIRRLTRDVLRELDAFVVSNALPATPAV